MEEKLNAKLKIEEEKKENPTEKSGKIEKKC